jgi:hypothetical protein
VGSRGNGEGAEQSANLLVAVDDVRMQAKIQCQGDHLNKETNCTPQFVRQSSHPSATARQETGRGTGGSLNPTYLEVAVRGSDMERGEPVEERGAAEQRGAGAERGGEAGEVAGVHGSKEVHLFAGATAADAVAHRRQPAGSSGERRLGTGCLVSCGVGWGGVEQDGERGVQCRPYSSPTLILPALSCVFKKPMSLRVASGS